MYIRMYAGTYVCINVCVRVYERVCMYFLCVCMNVCFTYACLYYVRVYNMCISIYSGKKEIVRYPSLGDALAAILQGRDELYMLAQETCCDLSPYWCSGLRPIHSHLCVFSRNQSFIDKQIFNHAVIIKFKAVQCTTFEWALF